MIKYILFIFILFLSACNYNPNDGLKVMVCLDGNELADLRDYCLANDAEYDPEACRQVRVNLTCEDPSTGVVGVLMTAPKNEE